MTLTEEIEDLFKNVKRKCRTKGTNSKEPFNTKVTKRVINRIDRKKLKKFRKNNMNISL